MRRRLVISTIAIVLVVLGALAAPIGLVVYDAAEGQLECTARAAGGDPSIDVVRTGDRHSVANPTTTSLRALVGPE